MEDLIKRSDAIERMVRFFNEEDMMEDKMPNERINKWRASVVFEDIPSAEKQGEWLYDRQQLEIVPMWKCSYCMVRMPKKFNFCPNCGADMRKGSDNETD